MKNKDVVVLEEEEYQLDFDIEFVFFFNDGCEGFPFPGLFLIYISFRIL